MEGKPQRPKGCVGGDGPTGPSGVIGGVGPTGPSLKDIGIDMDLILEVSRAIRKAHGIKPNEFWDDVPSLESLGIDPKISLKP
jgi:hypothetical protein